jgi:hypothetical protein
VRGLAEVEVGKEGPGEVCENSGRLRRAMRVPKVFYQFQGHRIE